MKVYNDLYSFLKELANNLLSDDFGVFERSVISFFNLLIFLFYQQLRETITAAGLYYFQEGQIGSLNPDLSIGEQADLLPYDKKWEVPREKIKLGKLIVVNNVLHRCFCIL